jgi:hypothetical protein
MTAVDVCFRYGVTPGETEMRAIGAAREVYGIRALKFDEKNRTVRVEYDASRINADVVESLLRRAGVDLKGRLALA